MNIKNVVVLPILIMVLFVSCSDEINSSSNETEVKTVEEIETENINSESEVPESWTSYKNERFNFCFNYPQDQFKAKGEPQNSDGNTFVSNDGNVEIKVYGYHNVLEQSTKEIFEADLKNNPERKVRKQDVQQNWYMISGDKNGRYFIEKRVVQNGEVKVIEAVLPHTEHQNYQVVLNDITNAFPFCSN